MDMNIQQTTSGLPKWLVYSLGALLIAFVALLVVQKGSDLQKTFKGSRPDNVISVSAQGKVAATPDMAVVTLGLLTQGTTSEEVKKENTKKVNAIIDFIKKQGVEDKDIQTEQFYFYPQQDWQNAKAAIIGYQGNQTITVKVHGIDKDQSKLETILDGVITAGANQITNVSLSFEDPDNLRQEARKQAISKAKEKAQELASEAGLKLGKVVSVSESGAGYTPYPMAYYGDKAYGIGGGSAESSVANIEPGNQDVVETMTVTFEVK